MQNLEWRNPKNDLPQNNQVVLWKPKESEWVLAGMYIESEKMFYIGFEQRGDFMYSFEVEKWIHGFVPLFLAQLDSGDSVVAELFSGDIASVSF